MVSELMTATSAQWIDIAVTLLRVAIGVCFVVHALGKLGVVGPGNMTGFVEWLKALGVPFANVQARMAMLSELVGGACLALGLFMRPACVVLMCVMLVAALIGHKGGGYLITNNPPGNEYTINLLVVLLTLLMFGPGPYSIDSYIF